MHGRSEPRRREGRSRTARFLAWLVLLRGSSEAIARGVAIGVFVAFTPTVGAQTFIAALLATALNANRPAAVVPVWITNPVTIPPIFAFTYAVGRLFWPGPPVSEVSTVLGDAAARLADLDILEVRAQLSVVLSTGTDILVPLTLGGVVVGLVAGAISYAITLRMVRTHRRRRKARRARRAERQAGRSRAGRLHRASGSGKGGTPAVRYETAPDR